MTTPGTFACPSCAAPLNPQGDAAEIKCPFCGSVVVVPPELRPNHPHSPQTFMGQATFTSNNPQVIVGQSNAELKEELQELMQELPQVVAPVVQMRMQMAQQFGQNPYAMQRPARRRGCGCGGCFAVLITLIIVGATGLGIWAAISPTSVASLIANIPGLEDLKSAINPIPVISTFTVSPTTINSGDEVTVNWKTDGDSVRLELINSKNPQPTSKLTASGSKNITVLGGAQVTLKLTAIKNGVESPPKTITITVRSRSR